MVFDSTSILKTRGKIFLLPMFACSKTYSSFIWSSSIFFPGKLSISIFTLLFASIIFHLPQSPYIDNGNHYQYIEIKFKLQVFYNFFTLQVMSHKLFQIKTRVLFAKLIYQEYGIQYDEVRE